MGWSMRWVNLDQLYHNSATPPILANDFDVRVEDERKALNDLIYAHYEGDSLSTFPSCDCGALKGMYNEGITCSVCNTPVQAVTERPLESLVWLESPKGVGPFISPIVWIILSKSLTYDKVNLLEYMTTPTSAIHGTPHKKVQEFLNLNIERGINYFHAHFDEIMQILYHHKILKGQADDIMTLVKDYRECVFTYHLPLPSKLGMITERTEVNSYTDMAILSAINAMRTITSAIYSPVPHSNRVMQARAMQANAMLADYHEQFMKDSLGTKEGLARSHMFASRLHFTFRTVIVSLSDNHEYDELHIPWSVGLMVLKLHLYSKMIKRGLSPKECNALFYGSIVVYNPFLDELIEELISESPYGGIPCTFGRNPTLVRGSIQMLRITKVKKNPEINSTSLSVNILKSFNADSHSVFKESYSAVMSR